MSGWITQGKAHSCGLREETSHFIFGLFFFFTRVRISPRLPDLQKVGGVVKALKGQLRTRSFNWRCLLLVRSVVFLLPWWTFKHVSLSRSREKPETHGTHSLRFLILTRSAYICLLPRHPPSRVFVSVDLSDFIRHEPPILVAQSIDQSHNLQPSLHFHF